MAFGRVDCTSKVYTRSFVKQTFIQTYYKAHWFMVSFYKRGDSGRHEDEFRKCWKETMKSFLQLIYISILRWCVEIVYINRNKVFLVTVCLMAFYFTVVLLLNLCIFHWDINKSFACNFRLSWCEGYNHVTFERRKLLTVCEPKVQLLMNSSACQYISSKSAHWTFLILHTCHHLLICLY